jgi:hypothetical protein
MKQDVYTKNLDNFEIMHLECKCINRNRSISMCHRIYLIVVKYSLMFEVTTSDTHCKAISYINESQVS